MWTHVGSEYGRHVIMQLTKGELILESIQSEIQRLGIRCGIVTSGIGSASKVVYHRIGSTADNPDNEFLTVAEPLEVGALQGVIVDGQAHLHITCCTREGTFAGHLEPGSETLYLMEISLIELVGADLTRKADAFGISYIDVR
ncbi:MAG: DNA-binding protein [Clostridia bacterium]|nr:DNA-binding protein [Clostridia bacterium]